MSLVSKKYGFRNRTLNNHGSTLIGGIFTLLFFSFFGMALSQIDSSDTTSSANHLQAMDALYVGQAGANQVIMLFELGVNMRYTPTSTAADFQDLVVLFTISPE